MSKLGLFRVLLVLIAWLLGSAPAWCAEGPVEGMPFYPVVKTVQDLPQRAEVVADLAVLMNASNGENRGITRPVAKGTKVFILKREDPSVQVLTATGEVGWMDHFSLSNGIAASPQEMQRIAKAVSNPAAQAALDPALTQLLQATVVMAFGRNAWGVLNFTTDKAAAVQQELAALSWARSRNLPIVFSILLNRGEERFITDIGYDNNGGDYLDGHSVDWHLLFPGLVESLNASDGVDLLICKRLRRDESPGATQYVLGSYGTASNLLFLSLVRATHSSGALPDCLVSALKKIAASNHVNPRNTYRPNDVEIADQMLGTALTKAQLEKWLAEVAKQPMPASGANLAMALMLLKNVDATPYLARLHSLVSTGPAGNQGSVEAEARQWALLALATRAPSKRVDDLLRSVILASQEDPVQRTDALRSLAQRPLEPGTREALEKVFKQPSADGMPSRVRQLAAQTLAAPPLRQLAMPLLRTAATDTDPYIGNIALRALRDDALAAMKAAPSAEDRSKIRGAYLEPLRKQVDKLASKVDDPLFKKSPLWMIKPQARISVQFSADPASMVSKPMPAVKLGSTSWIEPTLQSENPAIPYPDGQPRVSELFAVHPGKALFKYGTVGRKKVVTVSLQLDDLSFDGQDVVSRTLPGIYTVTLGSTDGDSISTAWYCEPDDAFWSEAGFEANPE